MDEAEGWMARIARKFGMAADSAGADPSPAGQHAGPEAEVAPGVRQDASGRFVAGGFSFSSLDQARDYAERRARPAAVHETSGSAQPTSAPFELPAATGPLPEHPGVTVDGMGRFRVRGFTFPSLEQALELLAEQEPAPIQPKDTKPAQTSIRIDDKGRFRVGGFTFATLEQAVEHAESQAVTKATAVPAQQDELHPTLQRPGAMPGHPQIRVDANGRYVVRGFSFSGLEQALDYARRLQRPLVLGPLANARIPSAVPPASTTVSRPAIGGAGRSGPVPTPRFLSAAPVFINDSSELVAGETAFTADMVYYGTPNRYDPRHDAARIDPRLSVDPRGDPQGETLHYWPTYTHLDPRARATYLAWLTGGRADPDIPIGYVFLFFYGLEQRLLVDDARGEASVILAELRRLLSIHGSNHSFAGYAAKLLQLGVIYDEDNEETDLPEAGWARNYELDIPFDVRVRLGRRIRDGAAFTADDCLRWVLALPDVSLRTPGQRCFDELCELWQFRFHARHPAGLSVRRPRTSLTHHYRAASGNFVADVSVDDLPDIGGTTAPLVPLRAMLDSCLDELDAYSRLLGREPEARGTLRADLLLPRELRDNRPSLTDCRRRLDELLDSRQGTAEAADVAQILGIEFERGDDRIQASVLRQVAAALDALHHGFEPDRRYGSAASLRYGTPILLFPAAEGGPVEHERPSYMTARTMVEVSMLAAASDGEVVVAEVDAVERRVRALPDLSEIEAARLMAWGRALAADPPKVRVALKKLAHVPTPERAALAACALDAVLADGRVTTEEVRFLEALHAALGLPENSVYAAIHRSAPDADLGPVTVSVGGVDATVPLPPVSPSDVGIAIDAARLERIRSETARVSGILGAIFAEEEPPPPPISSRAAPVPGAYAGLDAAHGQLLALVVAAPMDRARFEAAARDLRLLPGGALDAINEWGFDRFDAPVIEDEDPLTVSPEINDQLQAIGVAA